MNDYGGLLNVKEYQLTSVKQNIPSAMAGEH
jgi:hypothetical protein